MTTTSDDAWVITGESGEYSDTRWWIVCSVATEEEGRALLDRMKAEVRRLAPMHVCRYYEDGFDEAIKNGCVLVEVGCEEFRRERTFLARVDPWGVGRWDVNDDKEPVRYALNRTPVLTALAMGMKP